jgi:hypothetical protein
MVQLQTLWRWGRASAAPSVTARTVRAKAAAISFFVEHFLKELESRQQRRQLKAVPLLQNL